MAAVFISVRHLVALQFLAIAYVAPGSSSQEPSPPSVVVSRIAFGSCSHQNSPQPIWNAILDFDPQLFVHLGDNIYGDNKRPWRIFGKERTIGPWRNARRFFPSSEQEMQGKYQMAKSIPAYSKLRQRARVIGTWDDHDYGLNDAGKEFSEKNASQRLLLDFLDEDKDSPRRKQAGVYTSYLFGPKGKQIKVILLDTRYHRDPISSNGSILGDLQWAWLERELKGPESELTIVASSIQVVSNLSATTGPLFYMEAWGRFPNERKRLYKLINDSKRNGVFFISGDVHFGEITRYDCGCGYPLYDITSSGLTQAIEKAVPPPLAFIVRVLARLTPTTMRVWDPKCRYRSCVYGEPNFGALSIEWDAYPQHVTVELRDVTGTVVTGVKILFSDLHFRDRNTYNAFAEEQHCTLEVDLPWIIRYRLAFIIFGTIAALVFAMILFIYVLVRVSKNLARKFKVE